MTILHYQDNILHVEKVALPLLAEQYGTPCYVYSKAQIEANWRAFAHAFADIPHQICYAVKANSNIAILQLLTKLGSGFDIVSSGEFTRVLTAQGLPEQVIFSGVGKSAAEIKHAIEKKIGCFDIESAAELERIQQIAASLNQKVNIAFRVNPNIAASTHAHIATGKKENKFGIDIESIPALSQKLIHMPNVKLIGVAAHIGSQITELKPFVDMLKRLLRLVLDLKMQGIKLTHINIGGGLGICYQNETPPTVQEYATAIKSLLQGQDLKLMLEPGRAIIANAGILLTRIEYLKQESARHFAIVDAGMNDFLRPALYESWQNILPVVKRSGEPLAYDIAGPVCESADVFAKERLLTLAANDLLAIDTVGAYGFSMSSNYNARPRPAEVLIDQQQTKLIRRRETIADMLMSEMDL